MDAKARANPLAAAGAKADPMPTPGGAHNPEGVNQHSEIQRARENPMPEVGQVDNVNLTSKSDDQPKVAKGGNAKPYTLRRLARDRPDLLDRVEAGELSANAAAIEAGFRKPTMTVPQDIDDLAEVLRKRYSAEDCRALAQLLDMPY